MAGAWVRGVRRTRAVVVLLSVAVSLAGCSTEPGDDVSPDQPSSSSTPSSTPAETPEATQTPTHEAPIRLALAGDVHFEGPLAARLSHPASALSPVSPALSAADLTIVNLETSVGTGGRPEPGKRFTFSAGPEALTALAAAGVDVASMANNHALDYGRARLPSTMAAARQAARAATPLSVIGIGRDADEAFAPVLTEVRGTVVATVAASVADQDPTADRTGHWAATDDRSGIADALDPARLLDGVRRTRETADVVVVYLHWGVQGERCPSADQKVLAQRLIDAGADIVAGSHAHRLQGDGHLGRGYVAYGLGNFAWYSPGPTGVLTLTVRPPPRPSGRATVVRSTWWPAAIGSDGLAAPVRGSAAARPRSDRDSLRACSGLEP